MFGTAGLPHVIVRFFTVPKVRDARISAGWALLFISFYILLLRVAAFAKVNLINTVSNAIFRSTKMVQKRRIQAYFNLMIKFRWYNSVCS